MQNEVNVIPQELVKIIPFFDGDYRHLNLFIRKCEFILAQYPGNENQNLYNMHVITSRLTGKAAGLVSEREDINSFAELKQLFNQHFGDPRSEGCIAIQLESLSMRPNEKYLEFCNRIQSIRSNLIAKVNLIEDATLKENKIKIYDNMALNVFLYNLPEDLVRIVRLKVPATLEEALEVVLEEENFHEQYNMRNNKEKRFVKPNNFKPNSYFNRNNFQQNSRPIQPNLPQGQSPQYFNFNRQPQNQQSWTPRPNYQQARPNNYQRNYQQSVSRQSSNKFSNRRFNGGNNFGAFQQGRMNALPEAPESTNNRQTVNYNNAVDPGRDEVDRPSTSGVNFQIKASTSAPPK
ncbi:hypothetical protein ABMA28_005523 [Loxostege sticticalis]|uniref:Cytadhesion n=1 Tax=Loxostege sticticalis TaxID=481309 RepID=A0ABD0SLX7_LOXSC